MSISQNEARALVQKHQTSIDNFVKYGTKLEKIVAETVLAIAEGK